MRTITVIATGWALLTATAALAGTPGTERQAPEKAPSSMTPTEIAAFNTGLERNHPFYIKCRKEEVIGSLAKKLRVCRTNQEWARYSNVGNQNARDTVEAMTRAPVNGN